MDQLVLKTWSEFNGYGNADSYLATKLRHLKEEIRKWRNVENKKRNLITHES